VRSPLVWRVPLAFFALISAASASLVRESPDEMRLRAIAKTLRCLTCQGENVYDSRSELASAMRSSIRELIDAGRSDQEIIDYFVARYGDFVRLAPSFEGGQFVVWLLPLFLLLVGIGVIAVMVRQATRETRR